MDSNAIIKEILSVISPFDQEDVILIIEDFCGNIESLFDQPQLPYESCNLNVDSCLDKKMTVFSWLNFQPFQSLK